MRTRRDDRIADLAAARRRRQPLARCHHRWLRETDEVRQETLRSAADETLVMSDLAPPRECVKYEIYPEKAAVRETNEATAADVAALLR